MKNKFLQIAIESLNEAAEEALPGAAAPAQAVVEVQDASTAPEATPEVDLNEVDEAIDSAAEEEAEGEATAVAMEAFHATMGRMMRSCIALEELAEQVEGTLDNDGEGIDQEEAIKIETALAASGLDNPQSEVALESFGFSTRIATESFAESIKERASSIWESVSKAFMKAATAVRQRLTSAGDFWRNSSAVLKSLSEKSEVLNNVKGQAIPDGAQLTALRKHMSFKDNGNAQLMEFYKRQLPKAIDNSNRVYEALMELAQSLDSTNSRATLSAMERFCQTMTRLDKGSPSPAGENLVQYTIGMIGGYTYKLTVPKTFTLEALKATNMSKVDLDIDAPEAGSQNYKVMTPAELSEFATLGDATDAMFEERWEQFLADKNYGAGFFEKRSKLKEASEENKAEMKELLAVYSKFMVRASQIFNLYALTAITQGTGATYHALKLARASFDVAKAAPKA